MLNQYRLLQQVYDTKRTRWLEIKSYYVLRFQNDDIMSGSVKPYIRIQEVCLQLSK